jgi:hypothetical protein
MLTFEYFTSFITIVENIMFHGSNLGKLLIPKNWKEKPLELKIKFPK